MSNCKAVSTPVITGLKLSKDDDGSTVDPSLFKRLVGSLMYLTAPRPDIMYGVSLISRFMESPLGLSIMYSTSKNFKLIGYTDSDNGGNKDDKKITHFILVQVLFHGIQRNNP